MRGVQEKALRAVSRVDNILDGAANLALLGPEGSTPEKYALGPAVGVVLAGLAAVRSRQRRWLILRLRLLRSMIEVQMRFGSGLPQTGTTSVLATSAGVYLRSASGFVF